LADAQDIVDMGKCILKVTDILGRTQKLPTSLMMLRDSLESKRAAYEAKVTSSEKKADFLLDSAHNSPMIRSELTPHQKPKGQLQLSPFLVSPQGNLKAGGARERIMLHQEMLQEELDAARGRIESLTLELE
jgi:hypothetical protein